jgi:hypothetical protein
MPLVLKFIRKWNKWYRVLRCRKGFGLLDSVRYGFWLAHSCDPSMSRISRSTSGETALILAASTSPLKS